MICPSPLLYRREMSSQVNHSTYEQRARVGRMVHRVQVGLTEALDRELAHWDISAAQYVILSTLSSGQAATSTQICKEISYSPGAMTRMLDRLENKRMICRTRNVDNRRSIKLELTEEGKEIFPALRAAATLVIDQFFGAFDSAELEQFEAMLSKIIGCH